MVAYVDGLAYALGERRVHVEQSAAEGRLVSSAADLFSAGFRWHHVCRPETTAYDLAEATVSRSTATWARPASSSAPVTSST